MQIKPLIEPTKQIMKIGVKGYEWHELFPIGIYHLFVRHHEYMELKKFHIYLKKVLLQFRVMLVQL